ncbi:MAG: glycosyltransferase [Desulfobulbaceae bacterium]|nr:MAG: glycosyltransferase [Desulfobulbaceae bacterium]
MKQALSIIIPTLNEEEHLAATLDRLPADLEVVVVDGGSRDATAAIARGHGASLLVTEAGRGRQMNAGARAATGEVLLFLHADTLLPPDFQAEVGRCLARQDGVAGAFRLQFNGVGPGLALIAWGANMRSRLWQLPYGDQALFMERRVFDDLGGFPEVALLEDLMLVKALRKQGRIVLSNQAVYSSARKWRQHGLLRTTLVNQLIVAGFFFGLSPQFLAKIYGVRK